MWRYNYYTYKHFYIYHVFTSLSLNGIYNYSTYTSVRISLYTCVCLCSLLNYTITMLGVEQCAAIVVGPACVFELYGVAQVSQFIWGASQAPS